MNIAYFISGHGLGHASRAMAVMEALEERCSGELFFWIYTEVAPHFFQSLRAPHKVLSLPVDVGVVQMDPFQMDVTETERQLLHWLHLSPSLEEQLRISLRAQRVQAVLSDVSPLALKVAHTLQLPSVLVENFTWDWIYEHLLTPRESIQQAISTLKEWYSLATYHFQCEPCCLRRENAPLIPPVARKPQRSPAEVKSLLGLAPEEPFCLLSLTPHFLEPLVHSKKPLPLPCVTPVKSPSPFHTAPPEVLHIDLVHASSIVVAKLGYSTLAEVYEGNPFFGFIPRVGFPEMEALEDFAQAHLASQKVSLHQLERDLERLFQQKDTLVLPSPPRHRPGREVLADMLITVLNLPCFS